VFAAAGSRSRRACRAFASAGLALAGLAAGAILMATVSLARERAAGFTLDEATARAKALAETAYVAPVSNLPDIFQKMQFFDYQKIQPRPDRFAWSELRTPFRLSFYHQGMQFNTPVKINEIVAGTVREIPYQPDRFDFGGLSFDGPTIGKLDEVMSVLGASYFRVIGKDQIYGLSGRGLAIDTGLPIAEEFPAFREFWIRRPGPKDRQLTIYALMDSPRATGAYEFVVVPGTQTVLNVKARIFLRQGARPTAFGVAPLTSMFLYGANQPAPAYNFRPAIHDSSGLAIHAGDGKWIWRPLNNPPMVAVSNFPTDNPKGFGLLQRGREFSRYEDLKDRYDLRPSAWIEPLNDWGKGSVRLVEIPTLDETNDNIVAFWAPDKLPATGEPLAFDYRIRWTLDEPALLKGGLSYVWQTMRATGEIYQPNLIRSNDGTLAFLVDFKGPSLRRLAASAAVAAKVGANDNVEIIGTELRYNPAIRGWRLTYRVKLKNAAAVSQLHATLMLGERTLTETWSLEIPPSPVVRSTEKKETYLNFFKMVE
jgi:glucans biosynthesis protein